jgi:protein-tyrosine-phosphatase
MADAISKETPELIITMGCGEQCPLVPGAKIIDWDLPDPAGESIAIMREVRDEIEQRVSGLIKEIKC